MSVAVIADIIGSRRLADRAAAQHRLDEAIARVQHDLPVAVQAFRPTVGDEQQAIYRTLAEALASLLLLQLALPDDVQCRFGIGIGRIEMLSTAGGEIPEGPAWWSARDAIETVHATQQRAVPTTRTWVAASAEEDEAMHSAVSLANAYLLARDELVSAMNERARRLTYGRCRGVTQRELAHAEGISQPAVSQALAAAGAPAVVAGFQALGVKVAS